MWKYRTDIDSDIFPGFMCTGGLSDGLNGSYEANSMYSWLFQKVADLGNLF